MEYKAPKLQSVKDNLIASYQQFFGLETPALTMPATQIKLFTQQSLTRHYRVALFFQNEPAPTVGTFIRQLDPQRFLLKAYQSNVYRVVDYAQISFIQRV
ncbi:hypothetical protein ACFQ5J_03765 [Lacticaseibacillus baoqingensis]|uniref:Uncharacterized protein n=1 Tax=Lacticaseibacillus baoqingensis TaxID=2486013 RepID=A0ABW4E5F4_9LACO|nr:hypothetical protein [Lacticaseibacillus baoqingensis]